MSPNPRGYPADRNGMAPVVSSESAASSSPGEPRAPGLYQRESHHCPPNAASRWGWHSEQLGRSWGHQLGAGWDERDKELSLQSKGELQSVGYRGLLNPQGCPPAAGACPQPASVSPCLFPALGALWFSRHGGGAISRSLPGREKSSLGDLVAFWIGAGYRDWGVGFLECLACTPSSQAPEPSGLCLPM